MEPLEVFTAQAHRAIGGSSPERGAGPARVGHQGQEPVFVAVPFDAKLLAHGIHRAMAISLFEAGQVTLSQGARLAGLSLEEFIGLLGTFAIPVVDYPPEDLERELEVATKLAR